MKNKLMAGRLREGSPWHPSERHQGCTGQHFFASGRGGAGDIFFGAGQGSKFTGRGIFGAGQKDRKTINQC